MKISLSSDFYYFFIVFFKRVFLVKTFNAFHATYFFWDKSVVRKNSSPHFSLLTLLLRFVLIFVLILSLVLILILSLALILILVLVVHFFTSWRNFRNYACHFSKNYTTITYFYLTSRICFAIIWCVVQYADKII